MKSVLQFFHEVRSEISKVEWPTFQEFVGAAIVVLIVVTAFAIFFGIVDKTILWLVKQVFTYSS